eukprot:3442531-Pyramimonas_sp.AAC.1
MCAPLIGWVGVPWQAVYYDGNPTMTIDDKDLKLIPYSVIEQFHPGLQDSYHYEEDTTGACAYTQTFVAVGADCFACCWSPAVDRWGQEGVRRGS